MNIIGMLLKINTTDYLSFYLPFFSLSGIIIIYPYRLIGT